MNILANRKNFGILIIVLGLIVLLAVVYFIFFHDFSQPIGSGEPNNSLTDIFNNEGDRIIEDFTVSDTTTVTPTTMSQTALSQEGVKQVAASFAERLGSWSNQANGSNLNDLKLMMTRSMQTWADEQIAVTQTDTKNYQEYYGITTQAVTTTAVRFNDTQATIIIGTQRTETKAGQTRVFNQDLKLELVKSGKTWLIDGAYWL